MKTTKTTTGTKSLCNKMENEFLLLLTLALKRFSGAIN